MAQFDNEDDDTQQVDPTVAAYIKQKYLAGVPSTAPQGGDFAGTGPTPDKVTPDAAVATEKADDSDDEPDYSAKGYQDLADTSKADIQSARAKAANSNSTANFGQALATMFKGSHNLDASPYNNIREGNAQALGQATQDRQEMLKNYLMGNTLNRQATTDQRAAQTFAQQQKQFDVTNADNTPGSPKALALAANLRKMFPNYPISDDDAKNLSANDIQSKYMQPMELKAKVDAANAQKQMGLEMMKSRLDNQHQIDLQHQNNKFGQDFGTAQNKHLTTATGIQQSLDTLDQATKPYQGGVASQVLPAEIAKQAIGRVTQQELSNFSGDPGVVARLQALWQKGAEGTMTVQNATEYRNLLDSQLKNENNRWAQESGSKVHTFANTSKQDPNDIAGMVGYKDPSAAPPAPRVAAPALTAAPAATLKLGPDDAAMLAKAQAAVADPKTDPSVKASAQKVIDHLTSGK